MLKIVGALMLLCGCAGVGFMQVKNMDKRIKTIRALLLGLEVMERELSFRMPLLEEMLSAAAGASEEPARSFLSVCKRELTQNSDRPFAEIWNRAAREQLTALKTSDFDPIFVLGGVLGRYDSEGQRQAIFQTCSALKQILSSAVAERGSRGKVYRVLGTTVGAFLVILLV